MQNPLPRQAKACFYDRLLPRRDVCRKTNSSRSPMFVLCERSSTSRHFPSRDLNCDFILTSFLFCVTIIVLDNFIGLNGLYVGKNVGLARHIRSGVKLSSNNERNCVFRCVVSATHFLILGGKADEKVISFVLHSSFMLMLSCIVQ